MNASRAISETDAALMALAERLAAKAGRAVPRRIARLSGGRNNQVYRLDTDDGESLVIKRYFQDPRDSRDRLGAAWSTSSLTPGRAAFDPCSSRFACDAHEQAGLYPASCRDTSLAPPS